MSGNREVIRAPPHLRDAVFSGTCLKAARPVPQTASLPIMPRPSARREKRNLMLQASDEPI